MVERTTSARDFARSESLRDAGKLSKEKLNEVEAPLTHSMGNESDYFLLPLPSFLLCSDFARGRLHMIMRVSFVSHPRPTKRNSQSNISTLHDVISLPICNTHVRVRYLYHNDDEPVFLHVKYT